MDNSEVRELLNKYLQGNASSEEQAMLETWYMRYENKTLSEISEEVKINQLETIREQLVAHSASRKPIRLWIDGVFGARSGSKSLRAVRIAAAASIVIALGAALYFYTNKLNGGQVKEQNLAGVKNDVLPGKNTATLTLANGKTINLSDAKSGVVVEASKLTYNDGSDIDQTTPDLGEHRNAGGNVLTASTPRGGQYQVILPDGTKVWLNAASSLKFPTTFAGLRQRKVILSGEAYFEVSKDQQHPFIVHHKDQDVEVLGTHFNISSYAEDGVITTTLLEGSVKVSQLAMGNAAEVIGSVVLKPDQQAVLKGNKMEVDDVDAAHAVVWKNGFFIFDSESLESIMNKVARWYDVDVVYTDPALKKETFIGTMSRFEKISKVLNMLERTGVASFEINGNNIKVKKKI